MKISSMGAIAVAVALLLVVGSALAQEQTTANPLAKLKDSVQRVLVEAKLPFSEEQ